MLPHIAKTLQMRLGSSDGEIIWIIHMAPSAVTSVIIKRGKGGFHTEEKPL